VLRPFFLEGSHGRLFAIYHPPATEPCLGAIVHVPAFAEEANKSRHMVAKQARALALLGYGSLIFDYYGTGDSEGEFNEARWEVWQSDLLCAIHWCQTHVSPQICLWGLRFGGLVAASIMPQISDGIDRLIFWQPIASGEQYMTQFLRLRLANSMMSGKEKETVQDLKKRFTQGEDVEVAGYGLSSSLYNAICQQKLTDYDLAGVERVAWFEVNTKERPLSPVSRDIIDDWRSHSTEVVSSNVTGSQFWSNQEIVFADHLIELTSGYIASNNFNGVSIGGQ